MEIKFIGNLRDQVRSTFYHKGLEHDLGKAVVDTTLFSALLEQLDRQVAAARETILYPAQSPPNHQSLKECYRVNSKRSGVECWQFIISDIGKIALQLTQIFNELRGNGAEQASSTKLDLAFYASHTVLALRLMLLARFCLIRAQINADPIDRQAMPEAFQRPQRIVASFTKAKADYDEQVRLWGLNKELPPAWKEAGDSIAYKNWSRDFGQPRHLEIEWERFARSTGIELRYQSRNLRLRQHRIEIWQSHPRIYSPLRLIKTFSLWVFKIAAGFGLKPERFIITAITTILTFSVLYFIDDAVGACDGVSWSIGSYWRELFYAIVNFTSLGATPGPCGGATEIFTSIETIIGYFLLSMLAAILLTSLNDY